MVIVSFHNNKTQISTHSILTLQFFLCISFSRSCRIPNLETPTLVPEQQAPTNTRILLDARCMRLYWQSSGLTRTSHRRQGSRLRVSRARGFMKEKGIGVGGISTKVWDWLIQTLTERLHVSKRASGLCSCGLGAYLCSHSNQLMYDFTRHQGAVDRGEVPARWC